ncbi:MAG: hypothetical protein IJP92_12295 [Lachnospiraceae bacterium]|nr:hypothetical protein [Lachnospiraceae bacterium]
MKTRKYSRFSTDEQSCLDMQNIIDSMMNPDDNELFHIMSDNKEQEMPDTYACECLFLHCFLSHEEELQKDFPSIMHFFFQSESEELEEYADAWYVDDAPADTSLCGNTARRLLMLLYNAVKRGNAYAVALLKEIYKKYYKKEYNSLKRFSKLSAGEAFDLSDVEDGQEATENLARILVMARLFGIEIGLDCKRCYALIDTTWAQMKREHEGYVMRSDPREIGIQFRKAAEWLEENASAFVDAREFQVKKLTHELLDVSDFVDEALAYYGFEIGFIDFSDTNESWFDTFAWTVMIMRAAGLGKNLTFDDVQRYAMLFKCIRAFCNQTRMEGTLWDHVLGMHKERYEDIDLKFDPSVLRPRTDDKKEVQQQPPLTKKQAESLDHTALVREIEDLRNRVHKLESERRWLHEERIKAEKALVISKEKIRSYKQDRAELHALRNAMYAMTEQEADGSGENTTPEKEQEKRQQELAASLRGKKLLIVGGHQNWTKRMKELFPDWTYIGAGMGKGSGEAVIPAGTEAVFFFTDVLDHNTYFKYVRALQGSGVVSGYIHSVNPGKAAEEISRQLRRTE